MTARVIEDAGDDDYTLLVTDAGEIEARKRIPYDGVRYYTTATRALPSGRRTRSEYGLTVTDVLVRYRRNADTTSSMAELKTAIEDELSARC